MPFIDESIIARRLLHPIGRRRRLAARRNADARGGAASGRAHGVREHRGARASTSSAGACGASAPPRRHRGRDGRDRVRRLEPALARMAGATIPLTPAVHQMIDIGPVPRFAGADERDRVPDRARHGHEHVRAPGRHRPGDRLLRAPADPARPDEIPSIEEAALSPTEFPFTEDDFDAADGAGARADAGDRRRRARRHQVRDQRPALADAGRPAAPRRDARGQGPVVGGRGVGQGGAGRRPRGRRVDGARRVARSTSRRRTSPASTTTRRRGRTCAPARRRRSTRPTGSCTRPSSGRPTATCGSRRSTPARRSSARSSSRPPAGSARTGTSPTRRWSRSTASRRVARPNGTRAGGRRSSTPSTSRCATAPAMFDLTAFCDLRRARPGRARRRAARGDARRWTSRSGASSTRRCSRPSGGFKSDLTIMRLGDDHFRVVTGGAHGMADLKWFRDHLPADGAAQIVDLTSALDDARPVGAAGARHPRARHRATTSRTRASRSPPAARSSRARCACSRRGSPTSATSAGSCTCRSSRARGCGTWSGRPGEPHGLVPAGIGVYGTTGRLEKCYRAFGFELDARVRRGRGRHGLGQGEGAGLRRQGGARRATARPSRPRCCAR